MADDDICRLVDEFARLIQEGIPDLVCMENVPGLKRNQSFHTLLERLQNLNYSVHHEIIDFHSYGVPQHRKRLVLIASRAGTVSFSEPRNNSANIADYIGDLHPIAAGETSSQDSAHTSLPLSPRNLQRMRQSRPGGTWKDWDESLTSPCHRRSYYPAPFGRMKWDAPTPTITTQFCYYSTGRFGHPVQDRAVSIREAALLQTFPHNYQLIEPEGEISIRQLARQIGNAVPVRIGEMIGTSLINTTAYA